MPRSFCPHFAIQCLNCRSMDIMLVHDHQAACYRLTCQSCQMANVLAYDWPVPTDLPQHVPPPPPCMRYPEGWCPVATSGYCAVHCQALSA
jgi:hypothetical protein